MKISSIQRSQISTQTVRTYADLQLRMRDDLRAQHPEWVAPNGVSAICDSYERRLAELIRFFRFHEHNLGPA